MKSGKYNEAIVLLQGLITSDLTDQDKAMMYVNIATIYDKMKMPRQAVGAYDQAIKFESAYKGYWVLWQKAAYLSEIGEKEDSIKAFENLLENDTLKPDERAAIEKNIAMLRSRS